MDKRLYFIRKVLNALLTIVVVASFNFVLFRILPGNPARLLVPKGRFSMAAMAQEEALFHLNRPLGVQFIYYWADTVRLKFGMSFTQMRPVTQVVGERIWPTLLLVGTGTIIASIVGVFSGILAGWRRNSRFDVITTKAGMVMYSAPTFWVCLIFVMVFATWLGWFPTGRMYTPDVVYTSWFSQSAALLHHLALPAFTFAITYMGQYHLIMRSALTGVMKEDYVLTARAKGLSDHAVLWRHVAPNAMLPTVTLIMMNIGFVMSGAILVETVFNWPGIGLLAYDSMINRDYPVMQAVFLLGSVAVIVANLIADIMYYYLDPRVKA
jgi:peptide/nickel transport system permease protein